MLWQGGWFSTDERKESLSPQRSLLTALWVNSCTEPLAGHPVVEVEHPSFGRWLCWWLWQWLSNQKPCSGKEHIGDCVAGEGQGLRYSLALLFGEFIPLTAEVLFPHKIMVHKLPFMMKIIFTSLYCVLTFLRICLPHVNSDGWLKDFKMHWGE